MVCARILIDAEVGSIDTKNVREGRNEEKRTLIRWDESEMGLDWALNKKSVSLECFVLALEISSSESERHAEKKEYYILGHRCRRHRSSVALCVVFLCPFLLFRPPPIWSLAGTGFVVNFMQKYLHNISLKSCELSQLSRRRLNWVFSAAVLISFKQSPHNCVSHTKASTVKHRKRLAEQAKNWTELNWV